MEWSLVLGGGVLVGVGLLDLFLVVLRYERLALVSTRLYRAVWRGWRWAAARQGLPAGLALAGPLMIVLSLGAWMTLELVGFALLYYAGIDEGFASQPARPGTFLDAIYVSGVSLSTLGFGDIVPLAAGYRVLTFVEAVIGFSILTLTISYVLGVYGVLQHLGALGGVVHDLGAGSRGSAGLLARHVLGDRGQLRQQIGELHRELSAIREGLIRYPVVYYFRSTEEYRSLPFLLGTAGRQAELLRWGLPASEPCTSSPALDGLLAALRRIGDGIEDEFLPRARPPAAEPVAFDRFRGAGGTVDGDRWISEFNALQDEGAAIVPGRPRDADETAYQRYLDWLPFAVAHRWLVEAMADDLVRRSPPR